MKKTMRKSALLSSVAMLLVSAVVLTSATYAWFSAAKKVYVEELSAGVQNASGLQIAAKNEPTAYKTNVKQSELASAGFSTLPTAASGDAAGSIKPVSTEDTTKFVTGEFDDNGEIKFTEVDTSTNKAYYHARVWLKAGEAMDVTMKDTEITASSDIEGVDPAKAFKVAVVANGTVLGFYSVDKTNTKWTGIDDTTDTFAKESEESGAATVTGGTEITPITSLEEIEISLEQDTAVQVDVYLWLEGQDPDCTELMARAEVSCKLVFSQVEEAAA